MTNNTKDTSDTPPNEAGYYWCKTWSCSWWNLIVRVYGEAPYLKVQILWADHLGKVEEYEIKWGPRIADPPEPAEYYAALDGSGAKGLRPLAAEQER